MQPLDLYGDCPMIEDFARKALIGQQPVCSGELGFAVQATMAALVQSAAERQEVEVETL